MKRLPGLSVRSRFLLAFLVVALVPLGVYAALVYERTVSSLHHVESDEIGSLAAGVNGVLRSSLNAERILVEDYALWSALYRATIDRRAQFIRSECTDWIPASTDTKLAVAFDLDGNVIAAGGHTPPVDLWMNDQVQRARKGRTSTDLEAFNGRLYVVAACPIALDNRKVDGVGVLVFGRPVTRPLLAELNRFTNSEGNLAVLTDGAVSASTKPTSGWSASTRDLVENDVGETYVDGAFTSKIVPITDGEGEAVSLIKVSVPRSTFADAMGQINRVTAAALAGAVVLVLVMGLFMARGITRPLRRLATAADAMSSGDFSQHLDASRKDEIGAVASAFNAMTEQVAERVELLSLKTRSLGTEISALGAFGATLAQTPDLSAELLRLAGTIRDMTGSHALALYVDEGEGLELVAFDGGGGATPDTPGLDQLARRVVADGNSIVAQDLAAEEWLSEWTRRHCGVRRALAVPLTLHDGVEGAIVAGYADDRAFDPEDLPMLVAIAGQIAVGLQNGKAYKKLDQMYLETVTALAAAMEAKDEYTAAHADSIVTNALHVGRALGMHDADLRMLQYAAVLHDIGKIGVPGSILNKPGKLSDEEFAVIAEHTIIGERIISHIDYLKPIAPTIRAAHERWDGRGYPDGLSGEDIPLAARILLICDAYDAMTTDRPYRKALPDEVALDEIGKNAGSQFDPEVAAAFLAGYPFDETPADEVRRTATRREAVAAG